MNEMTNDERIEHEQFESQESATGATAQSQAQLANAEKNGLMQSLYLFNASSVLPPALDFVLPGMLNGTVGGYVSSGAVGKSMLALQLMMLKTGTDTLNGSLNKQGVQ